MTKRKRYQYTEMRKWGGDDKYSWAVFVKGDYYPTVDGLDRRQAQYHRDRIEKDEADKLLSPTEASAISLGLDVNTPKEIVEDVREERGYKREAIRLERVESLQDIYRHALENKHYAYWFKWAVSNLGGPGSGDVEKATVRDCWNWCHDACGEWEALGEDGERLILGEILHCRKVCEEEINTNQLQFPL